MPPGAITLRLAVNLTYRNQNDQPQIFQELPDINVVISPSLKEALQHKNQTAVQYGARRPPWRPGDGSLETDRPQDSWFSILSPTPNGVRKIEYDVGFQVHNPAERSPNMELLGKKIIFQMDLNHAMLPGAIIRDLQAKWHSYGTLWATRIRTQPIELDIPKSPPTEKCTSEFTID